jgi:lysophospholipid hydrolase
LREPPLERPSAIELHPDVNKAEEQTSFHNYLDEFLQAVRVFGFLEKPVFHELARHLQTRRLIAGDTLSLDADKVSFDGLNKTLVLMGFHSELLLRCRWQCTSIRATQQRI